MEDTMGHTPKNPKYLVGGKCDGNMFVIVGGETELELDEELCSAARDIGGFIPRLEFADIYVKLEGGSISPNTGFNITIPDH